MRHRSFMNNLLRTLIDDPCLLLLDDRDDAYHTDFYRLVDEHMKKLRDQKGGPDGIMRDLGCTLE